jgi:hypothetical protein
MGIKKTLNNFNNSTKSPQNCPSHLSFWSEKFQANYENFTYKKKSDMTDNVCCHRIAYAGTKECEE